MLKQIAIVAFREVVRARSFWVLLAGTVLLSGLAVALPVRFRDPQSFATESFGSIVTLHAVLFSGLFSIPLVKRDGFHLSAVQVGPLARSGSWIAGAQLAGHAWALATAWVVVLVFQAGFLVMGPGFADDSVFLGAAAVLFLRALVFCAFARLLGTLLPTVMAYVATFGLLVLVHFVSMHFGETWFSAALGLVIPSFDVFQIDASGGWPHASVPWLLSYASALVLLANSLTGWSLESPWGVLTPLERRSPKH